MQCRTLLVVVRSVRKSQEREVLPLLWQQVAVVTLVRHQRRVGEFDLREATRKKHRSVTTAEVCKSHLSLKAGFY